MRKMNPKTKILIGILVIGVLLVGGWWIWESQQKGPVVEECSLSLCDCKCHLKGQTPEELTGKICGINCLGEHGVKGCEFKEGNCFEVYLTEEESREIAENFVRNSSTYKFDGSDLEYLETITLRCPFCWEFIFEFKSDYPGYGDRTGKILAQVVTEHRIEVVVEKGNVVKAIIDEKWDELNNKFIAVDSPEYCEVDSDCVPEQCCHPTSCVNKKFAPNCGGIFCTEVCQGPIDCGAGKCVCMDNMCIIESTKVW